MTTSSSSFESPVDSAIAGAASRGDRLRAIREYAPTGPNRTYTEKPKNLIP